MNLPITINAKIVKTIKRMKEWVNYPYKGKHPGREWAYENKKHRSCSHQKFILKSYRESKNINGKQRNFFTKPKYCI